MEKLLLSKNEYETIIKATQKQLAKDDSRPLLKYIYVKATGNELEAVAVDGFMLSKVNLQTAAKNDGIFFITPAKLNKDTETIIFEVENGNLKTIQLSNTGKTESITKYVDGDFINYNEIITDVYKDNDQYSGILFNSKLMIEILKDMPSYTKIYIPQKNKVHPIYFTATTEDGAKITKILLPVREK